MQNMTLEQFRATVESGGILSVVLKAQGAAFAIQAETQRGDAVLVDTRRKLPRLFGDPRKALALLRTRKVGHAGTLDPMATGVLTTTRSPGPTARPCCARWASERRLSIPKLGDRSRPIPCIRPGQTSR